LTSFQVPTQGTPDPDQRKLQFPQAATVPISARTPVENPVLSEIDQAHAQLSPPAQQALAQARAQIAPNVLGGANAPPGTSAAAPRTIQPPSTEPPPVTPRTQSPTEQRYNEAVTGKAGIDKLPGAARIPLKILEAVGGATGLGRNIETFLPGTELHHSMDVAHAKAALDEERAGNKEASEEGLQGAQAANARSEIANREGPQASELLARGAHENAKAEALKNPQPKQEEAGKTVETDQGVMQWNPQTQRYDIKVGNKAAGKETGTVHQLEDGTMIIAHPDGTASPLTLNGQPV
jgi:hypothetical protein